MRILKLSSIFLFIVLISCKSNNDKSQVSLSDFRPIPEIDYTYLKFYPHDTSAFTEGLLVYNRQLFESTGATEEIPRTRSLFGIIDTVTGQISVKVELDKKKYFGEGIAILNNKIYQLTYRQKVGFIYDSETFKKTGEFTIPSKEGWGLTTDGKFLIMSDGTNKLSFLDPESLQVVKTLLVTENGSYKDFLNELEYINGFIYANIWFSNSIVKINTSNGRIVGAIDLTPFADECKSIYSDSNVLNGIAYDSVANMVYITGKLWPRIYAIRIN